MKHTRSANEGLTRMLLIALLPTHASMSMSAVQEGKSRLAKQGSPTLTTTPASASPQSWYCCLVASSEMQAIPQHFQTLPSCGYASLARYY